MECHSRTASPLVASQIANGKTYDERRQSIVDAVRRDGLGYWDETTSFFLVESSASTPDVAKIASAGLSATHDMLVAFDPSDMSVAYFGAVQSPDVLGSFFASVNKVP